jgi:hypothetical protein
MLLVLSESADATANYLCARLHEEQIPLLRIDSDTFAENGFVEYRPDNISLRLGDAVVPADAITTVWYRRPRGISVRGPFDAAQILHASREWGASLDCFLGHVAARRWVNHPAANAIASNKLLQLTRAKAIGLQVPDTLVSKSAEEVKAFWSAHEEHVVVKPLSVGFVENPNGEIQASIYTNLVLERDFSDGDLIALCPTLFQERIVNGMDVRVTVVDGSIVALSLVSQLERTAPVDIRRNGLECLSYEPVQVPGEVATRILRLMESFELRFGAIDMIRTHDGSWYFLEINPNGQWAWMDLLGVSNIAERFVRSFRGNE